MPILHQFHPFGGNLLFVDLELVERSPTNKKMFSLSSLCARAKPCTSNGSERSGREIGMNHALNLNSEATNLHAKAQQYQRNVLRILSNLDGNDHR